MPNPGRFKATSWASLAMPNALAGLCTLPVSAAQQLALQYRLNKRQFFAAYLPI